MHPYLTHILQQTSVWQPPPGLANPSWDQAFDGGTPLQRQNIANEWLWLLNKEVDVASHQHLRPYRVAPYARFYAKVAPYIRAELFEQAAFKGTFDDIVHAEPDSLTDVKDPELFGSLLETCWFDASDDPADFDAMQRFIMASGVYEHAKIKRFYPLLQQLLWEKVALYPQDDRWLSQAVMISVQSGLNCLDPKENVLHTEPRDRCWQMIAYLNRYGKRLIKAEKADWPLLEMVHATAPEVAVRAIKYILNDTVRTVQDVPYLNAKSVFNESTKDITDFYPVLRQWLPTYTTLWDTTESLGVSYTEALEQAVTEPRVQSGFTLPMDLSSPA